MIDPSGNLFDVGSFIASTCVGIIAGWVIGGISGYEIFMERSSKLKAGGYSIPDGFMALAIILGGYSYSVIMGGMGAINGMSTGSAILTSITMTMAAVAKSMDSVGMLKDVPVLRDIARILGQITAAANGDLDSFKRGDIVISASVSINISYGKNKEEYESPVKGDNSNSLINKNNNKNDSENNMDFVNFFKKLAKETGSASLYYQDNPEILQAEMAQIYGLKNDMAFMAHTFDYDYTQSDYISSKMNGYTGLMVIRNEYEGVKVTYLWTSADKKELYYGTETTDKNGKTVFTSKTEYLFKDEMRVYENGVLLNTSQVQSTADLKAHPSRMGIRNIDAGFYNDGDFTDSLNFGPVARFASPYNYIHGTNGPIAFSLGCIVPYNKADVGITYNNLQQIKNKNGYYNVWIIE